MAKSGWDTPPTAFLEVLENDVCSKAKQIAIQMLQGVIFQSPVDTGAFRANHRVSINDEDDGFDLGTVDKDGNPTLQAGIAKIAEMSTYGVIYIQNNLPYAEVLENGSSKQAPQGIYTTSFNAVLERIKTL